MCDGESNEAAATSKEREESFLDRWSLVDGGLVHLYEAVSNLDRADVPFESEHARGLGKRLGGNAQSQLRRPELGTRLRQRPEPLEALPQQLGANEVPLRTYSRENLHFLLRIFPLPSRTERAQNRGAGPVIATTGKPIDGLLHEPLRYLTASLSGGIKLRGNQRNCHKQSLAKPSTLPEGPSTNL
jgi:hypothetical protein